MLRSHARSVYIHTSRLIRILSKNSVILVCKKHRNYVDVSRASSARRRIQASFIGITSETAGISRKLCVYSFRLNATRVCVWDDSKLAAAMFLDNGRSSMYGARCLREYVVFCTRPRVIITSRQTSKFARVKIPNINTYAVIFGNARKTLCKPSRKKWLLSNC